MELASERAKSGAAGALGTGPCGRVFPSETRSDAVTSESINRRRLLQGAGVAGATVLSSTVLAGSANAKGRKKDDDHDGDDVEGAWVVNHRDNADPDDKGVGVLGFAEGGVVTLQEINPVSPSSVGAWRARHGRFRATLWSGIRGEGPDDGLTFKLELKGKADDHEIEGTYVFTAFEAGNGNEAFGGTGTFDGERVKA